MPTYEYRCRDCGHDLEVYQSFSDDPLTVCPACGGSLRKLFGNVGISFKGTGFYKNDHGSRSGGGSDSNGSGASDSKSDSKSESKPESKSESKSETKSTSSAASASA
jgi:putative FmdB family regulatory protein